MDKIIQDIDAKAQKIQGWFGANEVRLLYPIISALPENALFVEIGTFHGRSTLCWRLINPKIRILTNDICNQDGIGTQENQRGDDTSVFINERNVRTDGQYARLDTNNQLKIMIKYDIIVVK